MSAAGQAIVRPGDLRPLIKEARDRQRRRRRALGGALVASLGIAALVVAVGGGASGPTPGGPSGVPSAAGAPSSTSPKMRTLTARDFAKYKISCQTLRQAAIPVGRSCKTPVSRTFRPYWTRVVFGMSRQQVQHLLGKPVTRQGRCWQYPNPASPWDAAGAELPNVGICFFGGRASDMA